jgi:hypothetical protein
MSNRIRLGDEVVTYCGRCKDERTHQVEALNSEGRAERVTCKFCHSTHLYRDRERKATTTRSASGNARRTQAETRPVSLKPARPYSIRETFAPGDQILHPKFGQGEVVEARAGKIDVRFGRELRTLLHAG